jgi:hypothetical protein
VKRSWKVLTRVCLLTICLAAVASPASATSITFTSTDLADLVEGQDLWMYEYVVSDRVFDVDQGFSIYFETLLYGELDLATQISPDWDILTFQPDPGLPSDGIYDALALVNNASLAQLFTVTFVWLGAPGSAPGLQAFTVNQFDADGNISFLESGSTTPAGSSSSIPEPSSLLFVSSGLTIAIMRRWRRRLGSNSRTH